MNNESTLFDNILKDKLIKQGAIMRNRGIISKLRGDATFIYAKIILITNEYDIILYPFAIPPENPDYVSCFFLKDNEEPSEKSIQISILEKEYKKVPDAFIITENFNPIKVGSIEFESEILNSNNYKFSKINSIFSPEQINSFKEAGMSFEEIYNKTKTQL